MHPDPAAPAALPETGMEGPPSWRWRVANAVGAAAIAALLWMLVTRLPPLRSIYAYDWTVGWGHRSAETVTGVFTHGAVWWQIPFLQVIDVAALTWGAGYALYFLIAGGSGPRLPLHFWNGLARLPRAPLAPGLDEHERHAVLAIGVKAVFMPLMVTFTAANIHGLANSLGNSIQYYGEMGWSRWYVQHGHWAWFNLMLAVDTGIFLLAYGIDHRRLGNVVRSVEPTLFGWCVALACYPPFNGLSGQFIGSSGGDMPDVVRWFGVSDAAWWWGVGLGILSNLLFLVYVGATVALGWKAGNLVYRGLVDRGPYAWVRHPAYVTKNLAWGLIMVVIVASTLREGHYNTALGAFGAWAAWAAIYHLRALTEERHLSAFPEYRAYCERVRWRYLPGIY
jgi:protein-S-isoprenylcysteine O-methyltransferase Ste14